MKFLRALVFSLSALGGASEPLIAPEASNTRRLSQHGASDALVRERHVDADKSTKRQSGSYWYENIHHQGISAFGSSGYQVYRNVKDFGAKGDGVTDDTAAINSAISDGSRCGKGCSSDTTTPAVVYFPAGTYVISSSIIDYYYTQLVGNPNDMPTIKATSDFSGFGLINGDPYYTENLNWGSTNVFFRQVRNFIFDMTSIPASSSVNGMHWPTAQATSLQNLVFHMSEAAGTQHIGVFCESGSAGFANDLTFNGGLYGISIGSQQFTMRNLVFNNCGTAINQLWDWGFVYQGVSINNCGKGIDISNGGSNAQSVGSVILVDSSITNTPLGIVTAYDAPSSSPATAGSLILENVKLSNVPTAVQSGGSTVLSGTSGSTTISAWGEGNKYDPEGPTSFQGSFTANSRPASLLSGDKYYARSKPQYGDLPVSSFSSVRSAGAKGDGSTDDTSALQNIINSATAAGKVVFFDAGTYVVKTTLKIPPGAKLVGESFSVIMSSGSFFNDMDNPKPVVQVGSPGQTGQVEWSDMIVSTQGAQAGATLIQWNLATSGTPSGMWDVHVRVGGFKGSNLQVAQCEKTPDSTAINENCIGSYMSMHVTPSASGLYMENNWLWVADHDIDNQSNTQITIFSGRGLFIESQAGRIWLVGTGVEHHVFYQYQLANTQNLYMGFIQTETPYYQPNPPAPAPFKPVASLNDPTFSNCNGQAANCYDSWGLRIVNSKNVLVYGAGHYSFFDNYDGTCNPGDGTEDCQLNMVDLEGTLSNINIYSLSTVGVINMISEAGQSLAHFSDNVNVYTDCIALFRLDAGSGGGSDPPPTTTTSVKTTMATSTKPTTSPTGGSGWNSLGCYIDNVSGRALQHGESVPGGANSMTVEACQSTCKGLGYTLAGLEYASECYCGNTITNGGGPAPDGDAGCNMACSGNSAETCGGPNRLNVYSLSGNASPPTSTTTSPSSTPSGWNFRGCYTDSGSGRTLSHGEPVPGGSTKMTVEACQDVCHDLGYTLAGVEYSGECFCDNSLHSGGEPAPDGNAQCSMKCNGNAAETCGGPNRLSLYSYGFGNGTSIP